MTEHQKWLADRKRGVGASDIHQVLNLLLAARLPRKRMQRPDTTTTTRWNHTGAAREVRCELRTGV